MKPHPVIILVAALLLAADRPTQDSPKKPGAIQGTWSVVSMQFQGKKVANEVFAKTKYIIRADQIVTMNGKETVKVTGYKLHPGKQPKEIDLSPFKGLKKGRVNPGIYALEGDTLRICAPDSNAKGRPERPKEFATKAESDLILMVLRREKS